MRVLGNMITRKLNRAAAQKLYLMTGFIKTTDHRPTDHRPTDPPTTYHLPTDPPTTYPRTHRLAYHQFTLK